MAKPKRARIQDVAERAGVSNMTVSRVLNEDSKVSDAKKALVLDAVKALNYRPNVSARRLASNKSFFLGLLYLDTRNAYVSKFLFQALKSSRAKGYHIVADGIDDSIETALHSIQELIDVTQVDGVILLPPVCDMPEVLNLLQASKIPFVRIAPDSQLNLSPYICIDDYQAAFNITELLINKGHTKIGHIIGNAPEGVSRLRYQGYLDALRSNQINVPPEYIEQGDFTYDSGVIAARKMLALEDKPTAIFTSNDEMAAAAISVAHINGIAVPEELSIVGFDDTPLATTISPHLTTIRQPIQEMAELAISILTSGKFSDLSKANSHDFRNVLGFDVIERNSVTPLK